MTLHSTHNPSPREQHSRERMMQILRQRNLERAIRRTVPQSSLAPLAWSLAEALAVRNLSPWARDHVHRIRAEFNNTG